ncbi:MAG TPA: SDR family oxidoreductase, partial [Solirubrobacteraceae bacterium]
AVLLTGATGFVGTEVLARFLERTDRRVYALVRAPDQEAADERLNSTLRTFFGRADTHAGRVRAVPADIEQEGLGLAPATRRRLASEVSDIVHAAASVSFSLPLDESRAINVAGTRRMLEFAELCRDRGGLQRFSYVSTAYVAGEHDGHFAEDDLEVGQEFRNAYEQSKFEAERIVRAHRRRLPIQIFRPSIVVGERPTGWTASFNVLYAPLKAFSRGDYVALPGSPAAPVDVVPVDYVADAIFELANDPVAAGEAETYHLVAGRRATTVGRLVELSAGYFERRPPPLVPPGLYRRIVHPLLLRATRGRPRQALERSEVFFPYFAMRVRYGDDRARRRLEPRGIRVTPVERYFHRLAEFAVRARWGRAAPTRAEAARRPVA